MMVVNEELDIEKPIRKVGSVAASVIKKHPILTGVATSVLTGAILPGVGVYLLGRYLRRKQQEKELNQLRNQNQPSSLQNPNNTQNLSST